MRDWIAHKLLRWGVFMAVRGIYLCSHGVEKPWAIPHIGVYRGWKLVWFANLSFGLGVIVRDGLENMVARGSMTPAQAKEIEGRITGKEWGIVQEDSDQQATATFNRAKED